jgi:DNA-binding CsgD family transcriptional regulator
MNNGLTPRQIQILRYAANGYVYKEIAQMTGLKRETILGHSVKLRNKMGAKTIGHAIALGIAKGYLQFKVRERLIRLPPCLRCGGQVVGTTCLQCGWDREEAIKSLLGSLELVIQ